MIQVNEGSHTRIFLRVLTDLTKYTDCTIWSLFTSDLRVATCNLRFIIFVLTVILHNLLQVVTDNYERLTGILRAFYELLRVYGKLRFIEAVTC